jgi:hypothetical protein
MLAGLTSRWHEAARVRGVERGRDLADQVDRAFRVEPPETGSDWSFRVRR